VVAPRATGQGGDIRITTEVLSLTDGAQLSTSTLGGGNAGDIQIAAQAIRLNAGRINAQSTTQQGGNITLNDLNLLLLQQGSQISTTAGTPQAQGDGGNITINAGSGFIVATPDNNDITANSFRGSGGRVVIAVQGIFGLTPLNLQEIQALQGNTNLAQFDARRLPSSDITAISQTAPSLSGEISITIPDVDPTQGLVELPTVPLDRSQQISQTCARSREDSFIISGRGGLPLSPDDPLHTTTTLAPDWVTLDSHPRPENITSRPENTSENITQASIVEASAWTQDEHGKIQLIARSLEASSAYATNCATLNRQEGIAD
jgi:large exoprotein involved in heme utilization and adhesion